MIIKIDETVYLTRDLYHKPCINVFIDGKFLMTITKSFAAWYGKSLLPLLLKIHNVDSNEYLWLKRW